MKCTSLCKSMFSNQKLVFSTIFGISAFCLIAAFTAEAILLMEPCRLCIYQRYPYAIALLIGIFGLLLRKDTGTGKILLTLCSLLFFTNSAIAAYHTGVERHWWKSAVEGCVVSFDNKNGDVKSMLDNIMSTPSGSCEEIPWADPILGLSMANYNVFLCFALGIYCAIAAIRLGRKNLQTG